MAVKVNVLFIITIINQALYFKINQFMLPQQSERSLRSAPSIITYARHSSTLRF